MTATPAVEPYRPRWHDVPDQPVAPTRRAPSMWTVAASALVIGPLGPFVRTLLIAPAPAPVVVAVVGVGALVAWWALADRSGVAMVAVAVAAGVVVVPFGGRSAGLWLAGALMLAGWVALDRPPATRLGSVREAALAPVTVLALVATWRGSRLEATLSPLLIVAAAMILGVVVGRHGTRVESAVGRLSSWVRRSVGAVILTPLWLVAVVVPWVVHRLGGIDPLRAPSGPNGMVRRQSASSPAGRLWASEGSVDPLPFSERLRRRLIRVVIVVAVVGAAFWSVMPARGYDNTVPTALAESPWWEEYRDTVRWYEAEVFEPLKFRRQPDVVSPYFNVTDGKRVTWVAPECSCDPVRVWLYGGSTTFGFGQRDEHTIASELVRMAADDGITIEVDNRGVSGDTHWVEASRFAWDVVAEQPPDMALFYDGVNDIGAAQGSNAQGGATDPIPIDNTMDDVRKSVEAPRRWYERLDGLSAPDGVFLPERDVEPPLDPVGVGRAAAERYERSRHLSRLAADDSGALVAWFWQPSLATRKPVEGEPTPEADNRTIARSAVAALDGDVVDLTRSLDGSSDVVFYDDVHTNELGARLVAEAIYSHIADDLRRETSQ